MPAGGRTKRAVLAGTPMKVWRRLVCDAGCDPEAASVEAMQLTAAFLTIAARTRDETRVDHTDAGKSLAIDRVITVVDELLARRVGAVPAELLSGVVASELGSAAVTAYVARWQLPLHWLVTARWETHASEACPGCRSGEPLISAAEFA